MIFDSPAYLFLFLPASVLLYWLLQRIGKPLWAAPVLLGLSFFFYGYWSVRDVPLLLGSILFNYGAGRSLNASFWRSRPLRRSIALGAVLVNLGVLGYYKYAGFFCHTFLDLKASACVGWSKTLPLGISFFTFSQIAFLIDCYRGLVIEKNLIRYGLFVTFFPHLVSGPILHHAEMMPQFSDPTRRKVTSEKVISGLFLIAIGLFKKSLIADTLAPLADAGFNAPGSLDFLSAWTTVLSYTFQIYFDFSGYCDMALGSARLFNIDLPQNFNSPYQATSLRQFWRSWHVTLGKYLRDYVYIPLGGNRSGMPRQLAAIGVTFLLGGFWHGASVNFLIWGGLHGLALILETLWALLGCTLVRPLAWLLTFVFLNVTWVFFRADTLPDALSIMGALLRPHLWSLFEVPTERLAWGGAGLDPMLHHLPASLVANGPAILLIGFSLILVLAFKNPYEVPNHLGSRLQAIISAVLLSLCLLKLYSGSERVFLYYNF